ncbi:MAG TPA: hypothetical protein DCQ06_07350 [Myxococcales bacterium]|nr:hypothetical protein [Myxococcales bacterium]
MHEGSRASTERFQVIAAAYGELSDPASRAAYDRRLMLQDPMRLVNDPKAARALDTLESLIQRLGRGRRALPARKRGRDLKLSAQVPLAIANLGGLTRVKVSYTTSCYTCEATGSQRPGKDLTCHVCHGQGSLRSGIRRMMTSCAFCEGRGHVILHPCLVCEGSTVVRDERMVDVQVPPRTRHRSLLRIKGAGEPAEGDGPPGDVLLELQIKAHPLLVQDGIDLRCDLPVTLSEALSGCVREVPSLQGTEKLRIPSKSRSGQELRIAGQGLLAVDGARGDLRYRLLIDIPDQAEQQQLATIRAAEQSVGLGAFSRREAFVHTISAIKDQNRETKRD